MPTARPDAEEPPASSKRRPPLAFSSAPPNGDESIPPASLAGSVARPLRAVGAGQTDVGRQRKHNEDHILLREDLGLFVVADGMGGHNAGNVASRLATTSINNYFEATSVEPVAEEDGGEASLPYEARRLVSAVKKANRDIHEISTTVQQHQGMGSTIVGISFDRGLGEGAQVHIAHVGDSRCYRMRAGRLELLTRDHSLINDALELKPDLTEAELARLPKNIITRALGMKEVVQVDVKSCAAEAGDLFLLCSDGLSGMVQREQIEEVFDITAELSEACELLIAMANDAGGTDNISAVAVRVEIDPGGLTTDLALPPLSSEMRELLEAGGEVDLGVEGDGPAPEASEEGASEEEDDAPRGPSVICSTCGFLVDSDYNFCGECGKPVKR